MARLTRDFSGKHYSANGGGYSGHGARHARPLAYGIPVMEKRAAGERIGLLLVSVDDWHGGEFFSGKPAVERVCVPEDFDVSVGDWSVCAGLDCLVCGFGDSPRFDATVLMCMQAGAASVWAEFDAGIVRLDFWRHAAPFYVPACAAVSHERFGSALASFRDVALLLEEGFYGNPAFQPMRAALLARAGL